MGRFTGGILPGSLAIFLIVVRDPYEVQPHNRVVFSLDVEAVGAPLHITAAVQQAVRRPAEICQAG